MIIPCVAFHSVDSASAARMLNWCADLCGQQQNTVVIGCEESVNSDEVQRAASRAFANIERLVLRSSFSSWPGSAGDYFAITAAAMRTRGPWLWMEPDCVPTHAQWLVALETEFTRMQKLVLGAIIPMFFNRGGTYEQVGEMIAGVAVYHPKIWDRSPLLRSLRQYGSAYAKSGVPPKAFDCYLANDFMKSGGSTPLIQHMGRSREFRREDGKIVCSYGPESLWSPVVAPETMLVHGCKDESLIDLLRAEMNLPARQNAGGPAPVVRVIETTRKSAAPTAWGTSDAPPPERPTNGAKSPLPAGVAVSASRVAVASTPAALKIRTPNSPEQASVLSAARNSIEHWPECKGHVFKLNANRSERYRVLCECGAMSGKLPEGVDWPAVWEAQVPVDETSADIQDSSTASEASRRLQSQVATVAADSHKVGEAGSIPAPAIKTITRITVALSNDTVVCFSDGTEERVPCGCVVMEDFHCGKSIGDHDGPRVADLPMRKGRFPKGMGTTKRKKPKKKRTPEEQAKINARMATMRAKKKVAV